MTSAQLPESSLPLALRVRAVEQRLLERRQRIGRVAARIGPELRARMVSPGMLTAAVGFGVFLHRSRRSSEDGRTWSLVTLLNAAYAGSSLAMTLVSWASPAPERLASVDPQTSRG
jgi:hypothetical protein